MARQMKDSGVEWIGEMPVEWSKDKLCRVCSLIGSGTTPKFDRFDLSSAKIPWIQSGDLSTAYIYRTKTNVTRDIIESHSALKVYEAPFIVVAMYGASIGNTSISTIDACVNQACCVLAPRKSNLRYLYYAITACKPYFMYQGEGGGQPNISQEKIRQTRIPLPNLLEQQEISIRLDTKCAEIDKVVEQTRATIEEYKKLKQAIITEAVTKGVRGPRTMKPSGVEWIGDIPEEWHRSRVGLHYHVVLGKMLCNTQQADDYTLEPYYCAADIHFGSVDAAKKEMWFSPEEKDTYRVMPGDLLVVEGGAGAGGCAIVKANVTATYIQNSIMIVRGKSTCSVAYLGYWIESLVKRAYIDVVCNKATIPHFTKDKLSSVPIPLPSAEEQQEIATYLDTKCAEIDLIIEKKKQIIEELGSYKKSLIYEYVTGKKEVKTNMELKVPYSN